MTEARMTHLRNHCWLKALSDVSYCSSLPQSLLSAMMAFDHGWLVLPGDEMAQPLGNLGKSYMPIGYHRIDLPAIEVDTLYEFDKVHFINVTKKLEIESCPDMVAQLHHREVVHAYRGRQREFLQRRRYRGSTSGNAEQWTQKGARAPTIFWNSRRARWMDDSRIMDGAHKDVSRSPISATDIWV